MLKTIEQGKITKIIIKGRVLDGIKLPKRTGSGYHDNRPNRARTRSQSMRKAILESMGN